MKEETCVSMIRRRSLFIGVEPPVVRFSEKLNANGVLGEYDCLTKTITLHTGGLNRGTVKHEFLHFLFGYFHPGSCFDTPLLSSGDLEPYPVEQRWEENQVRKMVAMSWNNIKRYFIA